MTTVAPPKIVPVRITGRLLGGSRGPTDDDWACFVWRVGIGGNVRVAEFAEMGICDVRINGAPADFALGPDEFAGLDVALDAARKAAT